MICLWRNEGQLFSRCSDFRRLYSSASTATKELLVAFPALPPDVRRRLCLAVECSTWFGLCPWAGLRPYVVRIQNPFWGRAPNQGAARDEKPTSGEDKAVALYLAFCGITMLSVWLGRTQTMEEQQPVLALGQRACM